MLAPAITNALTIDVEDYFQVSALAPYIRRSEWDSRECRVERNVGRILDMLAARDTKATFFTLGWVAERYPQLVRCIVDEGHELASHGYGHERASDLDRRAFADDVSRAKKLLEDIGGRAVAGYRAPSFSIGKGNLWALDSLAEAGYCYSSSVYPIRHDHYGMPDSPRFAYRHPSGLIEVPVTTLRALDRNWPSSGGGYFRLLPYALSRWMLRRVNADDRESAVFYFHPWEIDPGQPRIPGVDAKTRFRHYLNLHRMERRLSRLLADFRWGRMDGIFLAPTRAVPGARAGLTLSSDDPNRTSGSEDASAAARWDDFVFACPQATFFHRGGWQRVLRDVFRHDTHFLFAITDNRITGVLPLAHVKSLLFGNALVSLPFAVYGGVAAVNEASAAALEVEAEALARRIGVQHLELRQLDRQHTGWPKQDLYVTFRKPIVADDEANLNAIPRKQRAMVRKGIKNGLRSEADVGVERFFALYADNVHRHGTPALPRRYFEGLRREFGSDCEVLTVVGPDGKLLSSVLTFWFRNEVLPYYAGDDMAARNLAANDFKYWELMRRGAARGATLFDYGRSKVGTGPYAFKKNWGFEPQPLHYEYRLYKREAVPQNNPANAKYRLMIEAWRRLPLSFANWLGPYVVRALG